MPLEVETPNPMDDAAKYAALELTQLHPEGVLVVAKWWQDHFAKAGHKRLGRVLLDHLKKIPEPEPLSVEE